jgi:hypothetical protein
MLSNNLSDTPVGMLRRALSGSGHVQPGPAPGEPVGLVRPIVFCRLKFTLQPGDEFAAHRVKLARGDDAFGLQPLAIDARYRRMLTDFRVHQRLGKARLVAFIVAEAAIAPHVDDNVALELLAKIDRQFAGKGHRLWVVAVDVQDRGLNPLGHVAGIGG